MKMGSAIALSYLRGPSGGPWKWSDQAAVITWSDQGTVAFREEIRLVLEALAAQGLPPFGAVVLLLAACRNRVPDEAQILSKAKIGDGKASQLRLALDQLARVSRMPGELNTGTRARCLLAEAVFEASPEARRTAAAPVLEALQHPLDDMALAEGGPGDLMRDVFLVARGLRSLTSESLALRLRTGLDALPRPAEPAKSGRREVPTSDRTRSWLEELGRDSELGSVARAARDLMAALRLPRRLGGELEMAAGGVADLSQRGSLDRLLLSELAHDDLTLSVRVALNEALYLQREPPKREPPARLAVLLDSGIRTWGVPRLLTVAVGLAVLANEGRDREVKVWRATRSGVVPVDLLSREGLIAHLSVLEAGAHPGGAIPSFQTAAGDGAGQRWIVVTQSDVLRDPEFVEALGPLAGLDAFVAVVDSEGRFALHRLPRSGRPPVAAADLDLEAILRDSGPARPLVVEEEGDFPAIFRAKRFPFLLPVTGRVNAWCMDELNRKVVVLANRQVARYLHLQKGGEYLPVELPGGRTTAVCADGDAVHVVKAATQNRPARLIQYRESDGRESVIDLPVRIQPDDIEDIRGFGEVLLLLGGGEAAAVSTVDGRWMGASESGFRRMHGRFYRSPAGTFVAAGWDGDAVRMDPVVLPAGWNVKDVCAVFERQGMVGPWVARRDGLIRSLVSGMDIQLPKPQGAEVLHVLASPDGHRVAWHLNPARVMVRDLRTGHDQPATGPSPGAVDLSGPGPVPTRSVFRVVEALGVVDGGLAFLGRGQRWRRIGPEVPFRLREIFTKEIRVQHEVRATGKASRTRFGCLLERVEWSSGSVAWIDSRGILHLRPSTPGAPELSILLADGEVAVWTSNGGGFGHPFFLGEAPSTGPVVREAMATFLQSL